LAEATDYATLIAWSGQVLADQRDRPVTILVLDLGRGSYPRIC
jgi:hypothetical protein